VRATTASRLAPDAGCRAQSAVRIACAYTLQKVRVQPLHCALRQKQGSARNMQCKSRAHTHFSKCVCNHCIAPCANCRALRAICSANRVRVHT
jgi:hypothetical protein